MKFFVKKRLPNGRRHIYLCGVKIASYKKRFDAGRLHQNVFLFNDHYEKQIFYKQQLPKNIFINGEGKNNTIRIHTNTNARRIEFIFDKNTSNNVCILDTSGDTTGLDMSVIFLPGDGNELTIGKNTVINGAKIWIGDGNKLSIGDNCMLSYEIIIRATDGHTILDRSTNMLINHQKHPCVIGNNCWLGLRTIVNKNTQIANNTIVASGTVLTKRFTEEYVIIAGNPGKIIKTNVTFSPMTIYEFLNN